MTVGDDPVAAVADELEQRLVERLGVAAADVRIQHTREPHPSAGIERVQTLRVEWVDRDDSPEVRTDGGGVLACPECDRSKIRRTGAGSVRAPDSEFDWHCEACDERFDEPTRRAKKGGSRAPRSGLAARLADPDVTGPSDLADRLGGGPA